MARPLAHVIAMAALAVLLLPVILAGCLETTREPDEGPLRQKDAAERLDIPPRVHAGYVPPNDRFDGSPYGVHVSFPEDPRHAIGVTWFTHGLTEVDPVVLWGDHPDALDQRLAANSTLMPEVGVLVHRATIGDLEPAQWIHYAVAGVAGSSETFATRTAPESGAEFRFAFFADHGTTGQSLEVTGLMLEVRPHLLVLGGDIAYADGNHEIWDRYFHMHEPLFARVPLMPAPGNHEFRDGAFYDDYRARFTLPNEGLWYGFDYSNVRFTMLEFFHGSAFLGHTPQQFEFFVEELQVTEARKAGGEIDFHAIVQHFPFYANNRRGGAYVFTQNLQEEHVLTHGVDLMLVAHDHFYERSFPMAWATPTDTDPHEYEDPDGYIQVLSGGGGRPLGKMASRANIEPWQAAGAVRWSFVEFRVDEQRLQAWAWAADGTGDLIDHFQITRGRDAGPIDPS